MNTATRRGIGLLMLFAAWLLAGSTASAKLAPEEVPTFQLRARVVSFGGKQPDGKKFTFTLGGSRETVEGNAWSERMPFTLEQIEAAQKRYPNLYMNRFPLVTGLGTTPVEDPTVIEVLIRIDDTQEVRQYRAELFASNLGLMIWRDEGKRPHVATMAEYNKKYWEVIKNVSIPKNQQPKLFPIIDRFIGGDSDRLAWMDGIGYLSHAGFSSLMVPAGKVYRDMQLKLGVTRSAGAIYNPPGYAFDHNPAITPEAIQQWADSLAKPYLDAGYPAQAVAAYAMSDEPGWYFPSIMKALMANPVAMARFHKYLADQGLKPQDVGADNWDAVYPIGRSKAVDLPSRKLFYWTIRFFAWDSSRHFAVSTRAMEKAFYPDIPVFTNWNFFSGRLYVPGPVANNPDKQSVDAAMGGHDWLEFGRMRGGTMLWTEDWFGDQAAYQWSFYCAKMRCAAEKGGVRFGGYVVPRTAGAREDGILQKILTVIGSGGKGLKYFVFGPEYNFPGNCYSENIKVLPKMAEAHGMIGRAEEILWPGKRAKSQVAILHPRSAELWDAKDIPIPRIISDATNTGLNNATVDYMAEIFDLYVALQHANIPVDFVEEEDLTVTGLKDYKVLYVTEPNIPVEGQKGLVEWANKGGTVVTVSNAGAADRYDDPCTVLAEGLGIAEQPRARVMGNMAKLEDTFQGTGKFGDFTGFGPRGKLLNPPKEGVLATFADGTPAMFERKVGQGRVVHFPWFPGIGYIRSSTDTKDKMPVAFSESLRKMIVYPTEAAQVTLPVKVGVPMIETPLLLSEKGAAVTLLNWTGETQPNLKITVEVPFKVAGAGSVKQGRIPFTQTGKTVTCTIPLGAADIVLFRP